MEHERRRYFRIDEMVGISYQVVDGDENHEGHKKPAPNVMDLVSKQDQQIEKLLLELADEHPKVASLVSIFNQKLERIVNQFVMESQLVGRIAHRVKEANISACGVGFENDESVSEGARLKMELTLYPSEKRLSTNGIVISCAPGDDNTWYWRIDFYGMAESVQETLIQHVVQSQSMQLKRSRMP